MVRPGHDLSRIVGQTEDLLQDLTCGICRALLDNPLVAACCRHTYCKGCIEEWLKSSNTCPTCREPLPVTSALSSSGLKEPPRLVVNIINGMKMECPFKVRGCPSVHSVREDRRHVECCEYRGHLADTIDKLKRRIRELKNENKELVKKLKH